MNLTEMASANMAFVFVFDDTNRPFRGRLADRHGGLIQRVLVSARKNGDFKNTVA